MTIEQILKDLGSGFLRLEKGFMFGPQGRLLRRNIEELWYRYCIVKPPYNVFLSSPNRIPETFETLQRVGAVQRPFGISVLEDSKVPWNVEIVPPDCKIISHKIGKVTVITDAAGGKDLYHRKQRERKVWWRKFSREPKRFQFTEVKKMNKYKDFIEIEVKFSFGSFVVETISYQQDVRKILKELNESDKSLGDVHIVEHTASLDWGCLAFLCDAYTHSDDSCQLKLHQKLSPYKVGFLIKSPDDDADTKTQEKSRLLLYLNNLLKSEGIETVVTTSEKGIEDLQVPLMVLVDDATLQNGIIRVWSQLTTLSESVHITDLTKYVSMRCR